MARQNTAMLYARVAKAPNIAYEKDLDENGNKVYKYGMCYLHTVRGVRDAHDNIKQIKHDFPLILSKEPEILDVIKHWKENDIVLIKGTLTSKNIKKTSHCPNCKGDEGVHEVKGHLLYITPIYAEKIKSFAKKDAAIKELINSREISNQIFIIGTLCREPKQFKTKNGLHVAQYQIAINRKFRIRSDDPDIKTDWPWVKTYNQQAVEDCMRLTIGSDVYIDGVIQSREIKRTTKCKCCGEFYFWSDKTMEIVPFAIEYGRGTYKTDEDLEKETSQTIEELKQSIFDSVEENVEEDYRSTDIAVD